MDEDDRRIAPLRRLAAVGGHVDVQPLTVEESVLVPDVPVDDAPRQGALTVDGPLFGNHRRRRSLDGSGDTGGCTGQDQDRQDDRAENEAISHTSIMRRGGGARQDAESPPPRSRTHEKGARRMAGARLL